MGEQSGAPDGTMSPRTQQLVKKICFRRAASVDMTQYGFISDSKATPVNLLLKPLRERLEQICGPSKEKGKKVVNKKKNLIPVPTRTRKRTNNRKSPLSESVSRPPPSETSTFRANRVSFDLD